MIGSQVEGPNDVLTKIYQSGPAGQLAWKAQIEEAVKDMPKEFWQQVCRNSN